MQRDKNKSKTCLKSQLKSLLMADALSNLVYIWLSVSFLILLAFTSISVLDTML